MNLSARSLSTHWPFRVSIDGGAAKRKKNSRMGGKRKTLSQKKKLPEPNEMEKRASKREKKINIFIMNKREYGGVSH